MLKNAHSLQMGRQGLTRMSCVEEGVERGQEEFLGKEATRPRGTEWEGPSIPTTPTIPTLHANQRDLDRPTRVS